MTVTIICLIILIGVALVFEFINGFHDSANAISMAISTKALSPRYAVLYAAIFDCAGALCGTHVAKTIGVGMVAHDAITQLVILCALLGAIIWGLITWRFGIPSSSSHALIGGLLGASIMHAYLLLDKRYDLILRLPQFHFEHPALDVVNEHNVLDLVIIPMVTSPIFGFCVGIIVISILLVIFGRLKPELLNRTFRKLQLVSCGFLAFSHGSNDAQKTMGIMTLSLITFGFLKGDTNFEIPLWVILICAFALSCGTMTGGWRIIKTMSSKIVKMKPMHGFAVEMSASGIILTASHFGIPVSTTHIISTAIMGVGSVVKASAVKWGIVKSIITAWVLTIPICMIMSAGIYYILVKTPLAAFGQYS